MARRGRSSCTSRCIRPIRCWKAPSPSPSSPSWRAAHGFPAVGLTDTNNLFGALEFSDKLAEAGIQPIVGCTLQVDFGDRPQANGLQRAGANQPRSQPAGTLALLASNDRGWQNLMKLASCAFFDPAEDEAPHIEVERLEAHGDGLIALTGGPDGPIGKALREGQKEVAFERLKALEKIFGDRLYVEIQRHGLKHEIETEPMLLELAYARALPIVATNEVYFAAPDDYEAHDALLCIADGNYVTEDNRRRLSREHFFKTAEQMAELFADLPEALGEHHRDRQALRLPAAGAQADPAALRRRRAGHERGGTAAARDRRADARRPRPASRRGWPPARPRRASRRRTTRSASRSRST